MRGSGWTFDCHVNLYSGPLHLARVHYRRLAFALCSEQILWTLIQNEVDVLSARNGHVLPRCNIATCSDWALSV